MRIITFSKATVKDKERISKYDEQASKLKNLKFVYVLKDQDEVVGVLRYSLFWQKIPFVENLFIDESYRGNDYGTLMMLQWEEEMYKLGYTDVMLSTEQAETAKEFYIKIGYQLSGCFLPPKQKSQELMFKKKIVRY